MVTIIAHIVPVELSAVEIKIGLGVAFCESCVLNPVVKDNFCAVPVPVNFILV